MKLPVVYAVMLMIALAAKGENRAPIQPFESENKPPARGKIDDLVFKRLKRLGIQPAPVCSDEVFVRRVFLDVIGTLPTADEARKFLSDNNPRKRSSLIDRLLDRREYADYWAMKLCDLLRVKSEYPINLWPNAVQIYHHWIRNCIHNNMPYDKFVREMLLASGSNFSVPQVNFYRAVQDRKPTAIAQIVGLTFMGVRPKGFTQEQWSQMAVFFSQIEYKTTEQWKEEIVQFDPGKGDAQLAGKAAVEVVFPDGTTAKIQPDADPRRVFADWLISSKNPWFARSVVNRIWSWLMGRGIIHEPDDIRPDNPACNPELLAYLEKELVSSHYDLKHIYHLILNSKVYQLSSIYDDDDSQADANFAHYLPRRVEAEVLIDAICQISGTTEKYSSPIPEPFTFIPDGQRSIELADGSIGSSFLEIFGRPGRDTGLESERNNQINAAQQLHLLNSSHIRRKIEQGPNLVNIFQSKDKLAEKIDELYLTILSRHPTEEEVKIIKDYSLPGNADRRPMRDLAWALMNSAEFLYRH